MIKEILSRNKNPLDRHPLTVVGDSIFSYLTEVCAKEAGIEGCSELQDLVMSYVEALGIEPTSVEALTDDDMESKDSMFGPEEDLQIAVTLGNGSPYLLFKLYYEGGLCYIEDPLLKM